MIYLNLIPSSLWNLNLRKMLDAKSWQKLSTEIREEQNWTCLACGISLKQLKSKKYFHCHEMWDFDDEKQEVKLLCLMTLCSHCHNATHFGYSSIMGKNIPAFKQICKVNKWDAQTTEMYLEGCFEEWSRRSSKKWTINYESIKDYIGDEYKINILKVD